MKKHPHFLWSDFLKLGQSKQERALGQQLRENILFEELSSFELKTVLQMSHLRTFESEETIFHQGDPGMGMYIILSGRISIQSLQNKKDQGYRTTLESGSFFGELALVEESHRRTATATALSTTTLLGFFKPDLLEIIQSHPKMGCKILSRLASVLGRRLSLTTEKITKMNESNEKNAF